MMGTLRYKVAGIPYLIAANGAAQTTLTGTLTETTFATVSIPANSLGANGIIRVTTLWTWVNTTANAKTMRVKLGGTALTAYAPTASTTNQIMTIIRNRNATNSQVAFGSALAGSFGAGTSAVTTSAIDTTAAQDLLITGQLADITDSITLQSYMVEVIYSA